MTVRDSGLAVDGAVHVPLVAALQAEGKLKTFEVTLASHIPKVGGDDVDFLEAGFDEDGTMASAICNSRSKSLNGCNT
jgi:hypothetical protein